MTLLVSTLTMWRCAAKYA